MNFRKVLPALALLASAAAAVVAPVGVGAEDVVPNFHGLNLPSSWVNQMQRDQRLGIGEFWNSVFERVNGGAGVYADLAVTPSTGLYVQVAPSTTGSQGALYQSEADDATALGLNPSGLSDISTALSADPTTLFGQGLLTTPPIALGPLPAGSTSGQSVVSLVECQNQRILRTPQNVNDVNSSGSTVSVTADRDLSEIIACQAKTGTSSTTPSTPSVDSGWVALAAVTVPYGATTISTGNIAMAANSAFYGFVPATASGTLAVGSFPHGDYVDTVNTQNVGGVKTFNSGLNAYGLNDYGGLFVTPDGTATSGVNYCSNGLVLEDSYFASGSAQLVQPTMQTCTNGASTQWTLSGYNGPGNLSLNGGNMVAGGSTYGATSATVAGTVTASGGFVTGSTTISSSSANVNGIVNSSIGYFGTPASAVYLCPNETCNQGFNTGGYTIGSSVYGPSGASVNGYVNSVTGVFETQASTLQLCASSGSGGCMDVVGNTASVSGNFSAGGSLTIGGTATANGGDPLPYSTEDIGHAATTHIERANGSTENAGAGITAGATYNTVFAQPFSNNSSFGCGLFPTSHAGDIPSTGSVFISAYQTNGSGNITGFTIYNNTNVTLGVSFLCEGW